MKHALFKENSFEKLSKVKYLKLSINLVFYNSRDIHIIGNGFISKSIYENLESIPVLKISPEKNQKESFYQLLNLKFPVYNFIDIKEKLYIQIYNPQTTSSYNNEISIKDYILEFYKINNSIKISGRCNYKSIDKIPIKISPHLNSSSIIRFEQAIFLIKNFCILFIENINEMERILLDSSKNYNIKNEEIKLYLKILYLI